MGQMRGLILIVFGVLAVYRGWTLHGGLHGWLAYALGAVSLGVGAWRIAHARGGVRARKA